MTVRIRLSEFLKSNNISQKKISLLFGVEAATISGIISGKSKITTDQLEILANHFKKLDLRWLLTGEGVIPQAPGHQKPEETEVPAQPVADKLRVLTEPVQCPVCATKDKLILSYEKQIELLEFSLGKSRKNGSE